MDAVWGRRCPNLFTFEAKRDANGDITRFAVICFRNSRVELLAVGALEILRGPFEQRQTSPGRFTFFFPVAY